MGIGSLVYWILATFGISQSSLAFSFMLLCFGIAPCVVPWRGNVESDKVEIMREELELKKRLVNEHLAGLGKHLELETKLER